MNESYRCTRLEWAKSINGDFGNEDSQSLATHFQYKSLNLFRFIGQTNAISIRTLAISLG